MELLAQIKSSLENLLNAKLRSALALLGVLIGTGSVVALISSGQLATLHALAQFKTLGTDLFAISIESNDDNQKNAFTLDKIEKIKAADPNIIYMAPYTTNYSEIYYEGRKIEGNILGATGNLPEIIKIYMKSGRFISDLDGNENFAVIGNKIAQSIRKITLADPLGTQIRIAKRYYTIIGVLQPWQENFFVYADINNAIIIPIENSLQLSKYAQIRNIVLKLQPNSNMEAVNAAVTTAIKRYLPDAQIYARSPKQIIDSMEKQRATFTLMLGAIGGIALIVGGIGVMNIMLVSVIERRREIGIRMAIGARRRDIQLMFLIESVLLTLIGGILGVILGILTSLIIAIVSKWDFYVFILPPTIGFIVSMLVGIFFGFYPALKASQLDPIETLRAD